VAILICIHGFASLPPRLGILPHGCSHMLSLGLYTPINLDLPPFFPAFQDSTALFAE
jgi:hypothetical protein